MSPELLVDGSAGARTVVLAHGAGAPMDTPFMTAFAEGLARASLRCVRFEFAYMHARRAGGGRKPPERESRLRSTWLEVVDKLGGPDDLVIGGKSMGGRIASLIADDACVAGLVCLGYPFHPAGKPERVRTAHLADLRTPTLIVQGTRDSLGNENDVRGYTLSPAIRVHWCPDGDHSLKPRVRSGRTPEQNLAQAIDATTAFVHAL